MGNRVITWRGMIFITAVMLVVFVLSMYGILSSRHAMEAQYAKQQADIVEMEQYVAELKSELARVGTDGYVENAAREQYDYVRSGEMLFTFADPGKLDNYTQEEWEILQEEGFYPIY